MSSFTSLWWRGLAAACVTLGLAVSFPLLAQEADPEEAKEKAIIERFVTVLEKNPRRGTALDKIYGYHVERGSLDGVIKTYREKAGKTTGTEAAGAWMVVGLMESLRGQDAASVEAFGKAETLDPTSYLASYYLGLSQVLIGKPDKAAEALERATQRKPAQADQLDVFQALGRVYQRAQKSDKALEVWNRLEKQFPNDARVQEQIATTLLEEGEYAAALPRFENLAKLTKDKYRQSLFQMEAAEIKVKLGKGDDARAEFEKLLGQLNPDNWLFREVRRRIENIYLRTDDQAGLIAYYEGWIKKNPEDLEAISRLSRLLAGLGRGPEAQGWLEKALKSAPTKKDLRHALIAQLMYEQKFVEVIAQYEQLDKHEPNNPDTLRDWGRVILKDTARDEATRKKDAAAVWRRLTAAKPRDPLVASQVAELFRSVEMTDEALELYQKAMALAPEAAQYKEYLGEYFHSLKRKDEAMATWKQMAEGKARTAANVARLAEVLSGFGYLAEAVETNAEACKLDPKEINLQIKQVDLLSQADRHEDALKQLDVVRKLAANDEEREAWLGRELKELQAIDKLKGRVAEVAKELEGQGDKGTGGLGDKAKAELADKWFWLARAYEAQREMKEAGLAVTKATDLVPQSIPILMSSARILEAQNNILGAVEINTKLAAVDRRYRTEYLKKVAQLEMQLGRREKAIQAGRDLIASAPGNPELYEFFSQLCFGLGEAEEGLQALRRSVRVNPTEPKGLLLLASALSEQFRTSESIELYWRAFDKAGNLEDRLGVVPKLTELYLQTNQFDRLLERLERQRREPNQQREMTICLAQAYQSAGDDGNARTELEKLLTDDTRDTQLLTQLVKLCESDGDLDVAVRYQQQLNKASPGKEGTMRLAGLLMKAGESEEATALMAQLTADEKDPEQILKSIDSLLTQKQFEQALTLIAKFTRDQPKNWELLYREGAALAKSKPEEAAQRFEAILALNLKDDEPSLAAKAAAKKAAAAPRGQMAMGYAAMQQQQHSLQYRIQYVYTIRQAVNLDGQEYYGGGYQQQQPFWVPSDYGQARMAAFAWQMAFAQNGGKLEEFLKSRKDSVAQSTNRRDLIDWYYLASLKHDGKEQYQILKTLSHRPDADREVRQMYLYSISNRGIAEGAEPSEVVDPADVAIGGDDATDEEMENRNIASLPPLSKEELEHVMTIARELESPTDMQMWGEGTHLELVMLELRRAGRKEEADKMFADALAKAKEPAEIAAILPGVVQRGQFDTALKLLDRLAELAAKDTSQSPSSHGGGISHASQYAQHLLSPEYQAQMLVQLMANRAKAKKLDEVFQLWKRYANLVAARNKVPLTPAQKKQRSVNPYGNQNYVHIWYSNGNQNGEQFDFPSINDVYDHSSIQMLRQTFALYRETEQQAELTAAFAAALKDGSVPESQQLFWQFGLGYLNWWTDEKDEALSILTDAIQKVPDSIELKFELASLHEKRRELDEALAVVDGIQPDDQALLQKRETMALRLSVNGGNIDRARTAAERLFGLRLDSNLQMALARQMHQLGMHEQAEAVLARAGRQAGNKTNVLSSLMEQYASTGKNDVAVQIAHQLLRRSKPSGSAQMSGRMRSSSGDDSGIRAQALQVMNRSGKLPEMIAKVESQLKNSPKSQRLLETLLEYYSAAGNDKKVEEITAKLSESKSDDPKFRYQLAMKLLDAGKTKEANAHLKVVFEKDPRLVMNQYWELQNKYRGANQLNDLADLYESIDMKIFRQQPHVLTNVISNMSHQEQTKARALTMFKKAWEALPDSRADLLSQMSDESFWKLPEIYEYARQGIIPSELSVQQNRWHGYGSTMSYDEDGKITTLHTRVLEIASAQKKLDALGEEVAAAFKKMPSWTGGQAFLALIDLRRGRVAEAKTSLEAMIPAFTKQTGNDQYYVAYAQRVIGQELMAHEPCVDLAIRYFELAVANDRDNGNEFQYTAGKPLMVLLKKQGRRDEARQILVKGMVTRDPGYNDPQYMAYRRVVNAVSIGREFQELGYPADAIKIYQRALASSNDLTMAQRYGGDQYKQQLQTALNKSLEQLKPESLSELLSPPVKPAAVAKPNPTQPQPRPGRNPVKVEEPVEDFTSVDLILMLDSRDLDKTKMSSALVKLVGGLTTNREMLDKTKAALADARSKRPDDVGVAILTAHMALEGKDASAKKTTVDELLAMIDRLPLEAPPAKGSFTPKQRAAAMQQAQLWLVARDCWKTEPLRAAGDRLAARALEAAKRQNDNGYALAILREWGQIALDLGDKTTAEQKWTEMLDLVLPKPVEKKGPKKAEGQGAVRKVDGRVLMADGLPVPSPRLCGERVRVRGFSAEVDRGLMSSANSTEKLFGENVFVTTVAVQDPLTLTLSPQSRGEGTKPRPLSRWEQMLAPALVGQAAAAAPLSVAPARSAASPTGKGAGVTFPQFQQAAQIAKLAAENGLNDLSLRAIEQSLHGGPPLEAMQNVDQGSPFGGTPQVNDQSQSVVHVQQQLAAIEQVWRRRGVPDERIYTALRGAILPESRPLEVFLYPQPLASSRAQSPQSIGALVVRAAVKAKQVDDLRQRLEARAGQPLGELPARIALTQLAIATGDTKAAAEQLDLVADRIKLDSLVNTSDLACHAALPALSLPNLSPRAIEIVERATDHYLKNFQTSRNTVEEPTRSLRFKLADIHFRNGNVEAGKRHLNAWVTQLATMWSNYSGDYPQYRRKSEYLAVAAAYAKHGQRTESLELLGRHADLPVTRDYGQQAVGLAGAVILSGIAQLKPEEQFALLKPWSMPTADRRSVRLIAGIVPGDPAPSAFDGVRDGSPRLPSRPMLLSSAELLVKSAAAVGQLDELQRELRGHADQNVEHAHFLLLLVRLAKPKDGHIDDGLRKHINATRKADAEADKNTTGNRRNQRPDATNAILAQAAIARDDTREVGLELCVYHFNRLGRFQDHPQMAFMRHMYNSAAVGPDRATRINTSPHQVDLAHWTGGPFASAAYELAGAVPMWWLVHEGKLQHICGPDQSYLFLNYPLTGTFEFSCDAWLGSWAEGNAGYGGLVFDSLNLGAAAQTYPIGRRNQSLTKLDPLESRDAYNRITIRVTPESIKHFVNGALIHEEPAASAAASPWLLLQCDRVWQTAFKELRITGQPQIPREVNLGGSPTLLGWTGAFYGEALPEHFKPAVADEETQPNRQTPQPPPELDWWTVDGEIHGRQLATASLSNTSVMQSRLHYCRPLRSGERLKYEFWYEPGPGEIHVHPALDRLAMILDPDGVKLHWMTESNDQPSLSAGLPAENLIADEAARRGPARLPLRERDWNRIELTLNGDTVSVSLNDAPIFERVLEPENNRQFGFYHDKHTTSVRVRNVVLSGDWPKSLAPETLANLIAPAREHTAEDRRQLARAFDDKYEAANIDRTLLTARALPPAERYAALMSWVLPNDDHETLRLYGNFTPADVVAPSPLATAGTAASVVRGEGLGVRGSSGGVTASKANGKTEEKTPHPNPLPAEPGRGDKAKAKPNAPAKRTRSGGELIAPAIELVALARELDKLPELVAAVEKVPETTTQLKRARYAMLVLMSIAANDLDTAGAVLKEMTPARSVRLPDDLAMNERWPELIAAWEAARVPELRPAAFALYELLVDSINRKGIGHEWDVKVRAGRHYAKMMLDKKEDVPLASAVSPKGQWAQGTLVRAMWRGNGLVPRWRFEGNTAQHLGGFGNDLLYFQSPLRGTFTVEADLSSFGWREARLMYGTVWASPQYTHEATDLGNLTTNWVGPKFPTKLEPLGDWYRITMEVTPDKAVYNLYGRPIHETTLGDNCDPWLAVHTFGQYAGEVRSLRITGQPEIPDELLLSKRDDLQGWFGDVYSDSMLVENAMWRKNGEEITGQKLAGWKGRARESLLQYHRPMLEDGEITYDFFHAPGQTHVHPALGRMALLLEPDGVKVHWLTDAQFERGGLAPDNVFVEKEHRRGPAKLPLKENAWNKLSLKLTGDTLALTLNGEPVYERPLEASNLRTFGLFHYAGDTDVRVKNVIYRGNWPKTLPSVKEQELAGNDLELATFKAGELPATFAWNFQGKRPGHLNESGAVPTTKRTAVEGGLRIVREPSADRASESAGFQWPQVSIGGDFEVTLGYRDFASSTKNEGHQVPRMEIVLALGGGFGAPTHSHTLALTHRRQHDDTMQLTSIAGFRRNPPEEEWQASDRPLVATSGRIRIVRRGGTAYTQFAPLGSEEWELLETRSTSTADVKDLLIGLRTEDLAAKSSAVLTEFSVRAKRLSYEPHFANGDSSATVTWNFRDAQPPVLVTSGVTATSRVERTEKGMKLVRELNAPAATIGYEMRDVSIKGDFVATLDYEQFETKNKPTGDGGAVPRVEMMLALGGRQDQPHTHMVSYMHRRERDGRDVNFAFVGTTQKQGGYSWAPANLPFAGVSGRLRIIRQGSSMTFQRADAGSSDWKQVGRHPAGVGDVKHLVIGINAQDPESSATVVFTDFKLEATGLASLTEAAFDEKALPARLTWNCVGDPPKFLRVNKTASPNKIEPTEKGLKLTRAANVTKGNEVLSIQWNGLITGDFEVTADYRDYSSTTTGTDWKVPRVELASYLYPAGAKDHSHVAATYHERKAETEAIQGQVGTRGSDNQFTWTSDVFSQTRPAGRLRLARKGSRIYHLTAPIGSNDWTLVGFQDIAPTELRQLLLMLQSADLASGATAVFTNLTIRADKIEGVK